jgi:asparagine synthase (glutamine-hydrolysing)
MCGITGFIDFRKNSTEQVLQAMNDTQFHRGPDGGEIWLQSFDGYQIGFGHRRLSIIDLSAGGRQPMQYQQFTITFNGEIYNYQEIKEELRALGHVFQSTSDTEMILHAFAEWGIACVEKFVGMFAIVLFDAQKQEVYFVRDRVGIKPVFFYQHQELVLFSSELKAFHEHPGFKKELNLEAVAAFLQYGNVPTPHCIFHHTQKIAPGHYIKLNLHTQETSTTQYWNVYEAYNQPKLDLSFSEALEQTENVLQKAFQYRMVADVPVGVFLSGGYDSTSVAALIQKDSAQKIKTFTIGVGDDKLNEAPFAKKTAEYLGTEHHEYYCTEQDALDLVPLLPYYYDEPFGDSSAIPTMLVSKMARQEVTVALSADAGDECFAGYNRHEYLLKYGDKLGKIPDFMRKTIGKTMDFIPANRIPVLKNKYNFANRYDKLKGIMKNYSEEQIMMSLSQQYNQAEVEQFFKTKPQKALATLYNSKELKPEFFTPLSYILAIDYQTYLTDDIMQKVDRASMFTSLEGREPFLDHHVIEWAAQLPDHFKYNQGVKKYILREITHKYVPKAMMERPKMGFAIPLEKWLLVDLKPIVEQQINEKRIEQDGVFHWEPIRQLLGEYYSGKTEKHVKLWNLLMFQMWFEKWMK